MSEYYNPTTATDRREALKELCMGKDSGVAWANEYARRGFPDEFTDRTPIIRMLDRWLSAGKAREVHQVACSSAREVAYFAQRYPHIRFVGSDIDGAIISACQERWGQIPNISFTTLGLGELGSREKESLRCDLVFDSGGLQYLDEPTLRAFFRALLPLTQKLMFHQPLDIRFFMHKHSSSKPRGNFSWNHPYIRYLKEAGWEDVGYEVGFIEEHFWAKGVSVFARSTSIGKVGAY